MSMPAETADNRPSINFMWTKHRTRGSQKTREADETARRKWGSAREEQTGVCAGDAPGSAPLKERSPRAMPAGVMIANKTARTGWSNEGHLEARGVSGVGRPAMRIPSEIPSKSWWKPIASTSDADDQLVRSSGRADARGR